MFNFAPAVNISDVVQGQNGSAQVGSQTRPKPIVEA
jgi:hypothetical protein